MEVANHTIGTRYFSSLYSTSSVNMTSIGGAVVDLDRTQVSTQPALKGSYRLARSMRMAEKARCPICACAIAAAICGLAARYVVHEQ